jgi:hypothetical protein
MKASGMISLAFHYYGMEIKPNNKPAENATVTAPGAGKITLNPSN